MIPTTILLPPLSADDRAAFNALSTDYHAAKALVSSYNNSARVARKKALKEKLKTAPRAQLLSIGAELETLDASFARAKHGAKAQLKSLGPRYGELFPRLFERCQSHANDLIGKAKIEWSKHFVTFGAEPTGESPVVAYLVEWKRSLTSHREHFDLMFRTGATPNAPSDILPYSTNNTGKR